MKSICISIIIPGFLFLASCSNKTAKEEHKNSNSAMADSHQVSIPKVPPPAGGAPGTAIHTNRSVILAEFIEKKQKNQPDFSIIAKVLEVKEDPAYPSIASADQVYELFPNFVLGEKKEMIDNQRNKMLMQLKNLKKGDRFRAVIFLDDNRHWMIQEILDR